MTRPLLDINVMIDLFLLRQPWFPESAALWDENRKGRIQAHFSSTAVPTLFYLMRKQVGLSLARDAVEKCINALIMIPVRLSTLKLAVGGPGSDFEDNLQIACAVEANVDAIITRDAKGFSASPIFALTPTEYLARINFAPKA